MRAPILTTLLGGTLLSLAACGGGHLEPVPPAYRNGFTGIWILNHDLTTDVGAGAQRARGAPGVVGRGRMGGGGFVGRGGGYGGRGGDEHGRGGEEGGERGEGARRGGGFDRVAMRETMRLLTPPSQMEIALRDSSVSIESGRQSDERFTVPLDEETRETALPDDHKLKTKARFDPKDDILVVERSVSSGGSVVEKYTLTPQADRIIVEVTLKGGPGGNRTLRRVYDREKAQGVAGR